MWFPGVESVQPVLLVWDSADTGQWESLQGKPRAAQSRAVMGLTGCPPQSLCSHSNSCRFHLIVASKASLQIPTLKLLGSLLSQ